MSAAVPERVASAEPEMRPLRRDLDAFASHASRVLSARAQARIELTLEGVVQASIAEVAARLGPFDRAAVLAPNGGRPVGFVLPSRSLLFALLELRFGARIGTLATVVPDRPYTRIEERAVLRTAAELWQAFANAAGLSSSAKPSGVVLEDAERLGERESGPLCLATFAVAGLKRDAPLRLAMPVSGERGAACARAACEEGDDASETRCDVDAARARAAKGRPDPATAAVAGEGLSARGEIPGAALPLASGTAIELCQSGSAGGVLRVNGRAVARGALAAGARGLVLRISELVAAHAGETPDAD
jgi:hypothetical protein